jgi:excisionase family DNA binding protein
MAEKALTTRAVAEILGVSEATVKRWADERLLVAERTVGGHRRFQAAEVARFLRRRRPETAASLRAGAAKPEGAHASAPEEIQHNSGLLLDALLGGREDDSAALLIEPHLRGTPLWKIFDHLFCEAMRQIGELWYRGELTIAQEHLATHTAMSALHALRNVFAVTELDAWLAVCCSVEDDVHELPVHLARIIFEGEGWRVVVLGANTPFFALEDAVRRHRPRAICISSAVLFHRDRSTHEYESFHSLARRMGAVVVLGGKGFTADEEARARFPADLYAESFGQLQEFLSTNLGGERIG